MLHHVHQTNSRYFEQSWVPIRHPDLHYAEFDPSRPHDAEETLNKLSQCMKDIQNWMVTNKLKLNQEKTRVYDHCLTGTFAQTSTQN